MINRAENDLDNRLVNEVASIRRELLQIKTNQAIGGDVLAFDVFPALSSAPSSVGPITVPSNEYTIINVFIAPAQYRLTLVNALMTVYIDNWNTDYRWPGGNSIDPSLFDVTIFEDLQGFNLGTKSHKFICVVKNNDVSAHNIYLTVRVILPRLTGTT